MTDPITANDWPTERPTLSAADRAFVVALHRALGSLAAIIGRRYGVVLRVTLSWDAPIES